MIDDDGNGIIDDLLIKEQNDFPSTTQSASVIPIPAKMHLAYVWIYVSPPIIEPTGWKRVIFLFGPRDSR